MCECVRESERERESSPSPTCCPDFIDLDLLQLSTVTAQSVMSVSGEPYSSMQPPSAVELQV